MLKITGGSARGRRIKLPPGEVRPAMARIRQSTFDYLSGILPGARILDLYCGSGCLGLEAISRGANEAWFVDISGQVIDVAMDNAYILGFYDRCHFITLDVFKFLTHCTHRSQPSAIDNGVSDSSGVGGRQLSGKFDLVFAAPPYRIAEPDNILKSLAESSTLAKGGCVCIEYSRHTTQPEPDRFFLDRRREYGETVIEVWDYNPASHQNEKID